MNKLTQEETAKVLAMHLGVECTRGYMTTNRIEQTVSGDLPSDVKLLLIPISKMTDDHSRILCLNFTNNLYAKKDKLLSINEGKALANNICNPSSGFAISYSFAYIQLIQWGYDVPLFFSYKGHWANYKTAIQLGIAIEKP